jgi:ATPase subunit of ABC transporter with duplicated ATPase domains
MNYLSVENLTKSYGEKLLFENISFGLDAGQKVALIAKNGTGKTLSTIIFRESKRMAKTITEFLQFARPAPMQGEWFALKRVVDETIAAAVNLQAGYEDGAIRVEVQDNLDAFGDRQQLQTVLSHLLENSMTFSQREDGSITVTAHEEEHEEPLSIEDAVKETIKELEKEQNEVPEHTLLKKLNSKGYDIDEDSLEKILNKLKLYGEIHEVRSGRWKTL